MAPMEFGNYKGKVIWFTRKMHYDFTCCMKLLVLSAYGSSCALLTLLGLLLEKASCVGNSTLKNKSSRLAKSDFWFPVQLCKEKTLYWYLPPGFSVVQGNTAPFHPLVKYYYNVSARKLVSCHLAMAELGCSIWLCGCILMIILSFSSSCFQASFLSGSKEIQSQSCCSFEELKWPLIVRPCLS